MCIDKGRQRCLSQSSQQLSIYTPAELPGLSHAPTAARSLQHVPAGTATHPAPQPRQPAAAAADRLPLSHQRVSQQGLRGSARSSELQPRECPAAEGRACGLTAAPVPPCSAHSLIMACLTHDCAMPVSLTYVLGVSRSSCLLVPDARAYLPEARQETGLMTGLWHELDAHA